MWAQGLQAQHGQSAGPGPDTRTCEAASAHLHLWLASLLLQQVGKSTHPLSGLEQHGACAGAQGIVPEGEWGAFMAALRRPLPAAFRINGSGRFAADLRDRLTQDFFSQFSARIMVRVPCFSGLLSNDVSIAGGSVGCATCLHVIPLLGCLTCASVPVPVIFGCMATSSRNPNNLVK